MQGNPFYVAPMLGLSDPAGAFERGRQGAQRQALFTQQQELLQQQQAQAQQMAADRAALSAAPDMETKYQILSRNPDLLEEYRNQAEFFSDESKKLHLSAGQGLLNASSLDDAVRIQQEKLRTMKQIPGLDTSNSERQLQRMLDGGMTLEDVKSEAKLELLAHPEGQDYLNNLQKSQELAGSHDLIQLTNARNRIAAQNPNSPLLATYDKAIEAQTVKMATASGGDTAAINNFNKWLELNQSDLSAMPRNEAQKVMAQAFEEFARPSQLVQTGGGGYALVDRVSGNRRDVVSAEEAIAREADKAGATSAAGVVGSAKGEQQVADPRDLVQVQGVLDLIDQAIKHPGREAATGASSIFNRVAAPGSDRKNFLVLAEQLKGKNFLDVYQSLKGGGPITDVEGAKAEASQARLNMAQSEDEYMRALMEMRDLLEDRKKRIEQRLPKPENAGSSSNRVGRFEMVIED